MAARPGAVRGQSDTESRLPSHRIVHRFDFDERPAGNLEDEPKYWVPLKLAGFPRFAVGAFDFEVGRTSPPSFHLASEGRSVAYQYTGPETRVRANTDYRVEGFIRADRLRAARACLNAHYLDEHGRPIAGTVVRSRFVGGAGEPDGWAGFELYLPPATGEACTIGLVAWVLAESKWNISTLTRRHIPRTDVHGGAWFDDITIYALPRAEITTSAAGHVLTPEGAQELQVVLADPEDTSLEGMLSITAADGGLVETHPISVVVDEHVDPVHIHVGHLSPGLYEASLDVAADGAPVVSRRLVFARAAPPNRHGDTAARPFGVVVDPRYRSDPATELALLQKQLARSVKLPVWTGLAEDPPTAAARRTTDRLLRDLLKSGFGLSGVFVGPPGAIVQSDGPYPRALLAFLADQPSAWQDHLAMVVAPYAGIFRWWQVGPDGGKEVEEGDQLPRALEHLRTAMRRFITMPQLAIPASSAVELAGKEPAVEQVTLTLGSQIHPDWLASEIQRAYRRGYDFVSAFVEPLPAERYQRIPRLASWAQRIITARHAGAQTVFVPQTWTVRDTSQGRVTEPTEEYLILRTIADVLGGAVPGERVRVTPGVYCLAFHDGDSTVLALWDTQAPPEGRNHAIQLGQANRQIDLWGRSSPFERDEHGRQIVRLSSMPVLVDGVERWLIDFRTALTLEPGHVETGWELVEHKLGMAYEGLEAVSGRISFDAPGSWEITPRTLMFSLMPQRTEEFPLQVRYSHNEPAGQRDLIAQILLSQTSYYLEVPLSVELGLSDVDVWGMAVLEGDELVLTHAVTNRSKKPLHFRGAASVPGRERQYRPFLNLHSRETQTVEYRFVNGAGLAGSTVRLALREMNDGPRIHNLELTVP